MGSGMLSEMNMSNFMVCRSQGVGIDCRVRKRSCHADVEMEQDLCDSATREIEERETCNIIHFLIALSVLAYLEVIQGWYSL